MMKCVNILLYFSSLLFVNEAKLTWNHTYTYEAILTVPEAEIKEPYKVWVDGKTGNSRVDFYNGLVKLYRFRLLGPNETYSYFKIYPETVNSTTKETCVRFTEANLIRVYGSMTYLPNRDFAYKGITKLNDLNYQIWQDRESYLICGYNITKNYTMWTSATVYKDEIISVPVRYVYTATAGDVVMDNFTHDYLSYSVADIDRSIFDLPESIPCMDNIKLSSEPVDPLLEYIDPSRESARLFEEFKSFKEQYKKAYANDREEFMRMNAFRNNLRFINSHNRQNKSYSLAVNHLSDMTKDDMAVFMGTYNVHIDDRDGDDDDLDQEEGITEDYIEKNISKDYNKFLDWREYGAVSLVKDQTSLCESCYAFSVAAAVEAAAYIQGGFVELKEVSEQAIIDCSWRVSPYGNFGCKGGTFESSLRWIRDNGVPFKSDYGPYLAMEGLCHSENVTSKAHIKGFKRLIQDVGIIKKTLRKQGPLLVAVNSRQISFLSYKKGIYNDLKCKSHPKYISHSLVLIGYGHADGQDYWLLKNTFGKQWGEDGFIRIAMKDNICGVTNLVYSILHAKK